jgi:hypothetical protein
MGGQNNGGPQLIVTHMQNAPLIINKGIGNGDRGHIAMYSIYAQDVSC